MPNEAYWGTKPTISKVIFQFIPESSAELEAVKTGQVVAAYPLPIDGALDELDESPNLTYSVDLRQPVRGALGQRRRVPARQ